MAALLRTEFPRVEQLQTQVGRQLTLFSALVTFVLILMVELLRASEEGSRDCWYWLPSLFEVLSALWSACVASMLGGLIMHRSAHAASEDACVAWSAFAGVAYIALRQVPSFFVHHWQVPSGLELLMNTLFAVTMGPLLGLLVAALFLTSVLSPMLGQLQSPTQDAMAHAWMACARLCLLGALVALGPKALSASLLLWPPVALLGLCAALSFVRSRSLRRAFDRLRQGLLAGTHKTLHIVPGESSEEALPLTELDRVAGERRVLIKRETGAYRQSAAALGVYVTLPSTR